MEMFLKQEPHSLNSTNMNRQTILKAATALLLLSANPSASFSQETFKGSKHCFQFSMGGTINATKYQNGNLADNMTKRPNSDFSYFLRYTFFPLKHWGIYAEIQNPDRVFDLLKEDFIKQLEDTYFIIDNHSSTDNTGITFNLGIVYRKETKRWVFLPRISFGSTAQGKNSIFLSLKEIDSNNLYHLNIDSEDHKQSLRSPNITAGISVQYKVAKYLYLTADVGYAQMLKQPVFTYSKTCLYSGQTIEQKIYIANHSRKNFTISTGICIPIYPRSYKKQKRTNFTPPTPPLPSL